MQPSGSAPVTDLFLRWKAGDREGLDQTVSLVECEPRRTAPGAMPDERPGPTSKFAARKAAEARVAKEG